MSYSRYEDALIAKLRLLEFTTSETGGRYLRGFQESMNSQHVPSERLPTGMIHALQAKSLAEAEPIYVSPDVIDLVDHARETFQPETLLPSDPFTPCGFALFPRPVMLDDAPVTEKNPFRSPGGFIPVRAISWMALHNEDLSAGCFWISFYSHMDDDEEQQRAHATSDQVSWLRSIAPMSLGHTWQWQWGVDPRGMAAQLIQGEDPERSQKRAHEQASFVQTFWRLGQQFIPIKQPAPRQVWRDAKRKGATVHKEVTVMVLRRAREVGEQIEHETDRHYKVSFLVRGYWAVRHFKDGPRQVWVRPHLKGQGPFQETTRAWEFKR